MVAQLIDDDPALAHEHAISASRRAGRIPVARETLAMTAYRTGDFALALREIRTFRRLSGRDDHIAILVDSERGMERPDKAIEAGLAVDASKLDTEQRVHLAIAMSGARLDLNQTQQALLELEIPELNPNRAFSWSPELFGAYATVLEDLGRAEESEKWFAYADRAAAALHEHAAGFDQLEVFEIVEEEPIEFDEDDAYETDSYDADDSAEGADRDSDTDAPVDDADDAAGADEVAEPAPAADADALVAEAEAEAETEEDSMSIEDEVAELLAEAGIVDTAGEDAAVESETEEAETADEDDADEAYAEAYVETEAESVAEPVAEEAEADAADVATEAQND
nr:MULTISPECIES: hypothetical protein [unclassified Leucobacter]